MAARRPHRAPSCHRFPRAAGEERAPQDATGPGAGSPPGKPAPASWPAAAPGPAGPGPGPRPGDAAAAREGAAVVLTSAEAAWEALRGHDLDCCTRPVSAGTRRVTYGMKNVAFAPYGAYWREVRKLLMVELLSARRVKAAWYARHEQVSVTKPVVKFDFIHYCCMVLSRGWFLSSVIFYICHVSLICIKKLIYDTKSILIVGSNNAHPL